MSLDGRQTNAGNITLELRSPLIHELFSLMILILCVLAVVVVYMYSVCVCVHVCVHVCVCRHPHVCVYLCMFVLSTKYMCKCF